jgi:hypothetical protein
MVENLPYVDPVVKKGRNMQCGKGSVRYEEYCIIHPTRCNVTQFILSGNGCTCFG